MPLRILRIVTRMNVGGSSREIAALMRELDPAEFEQRLLVGELAYGEADYLAMVPDVQATSVPGLCREIAPAKDVKAYRWIAAEIRRWRPDIVHTHLSKAGALGRLAAIRSGVPSIVHTFHGHILYGIVSPKVSRGAAVAERWLAKRSSHLISVGERVMGELLAARIGEPDQFTVVAPSVSLPLAPSRADARTILGLPAGPTIVASVGRLTRQKRPDRFVEVALRVAARHHDVLFVLAGDGDLGEDVRRQAAGSGRVVFLGWRPDVENVLSAADIVLQTSDNEGMPLALIEAALLGKPVVAHAVGSTAEVVLDGETGLIAAAEVDDCVSKVEQLLGDAGLRARLGAAASDRAARMFPPERLARDIADVYRSLVRVG